MAEDNPDEIAYTITKYLEDGQTITEHSSRNYTGKASVVYATKDRYEGDFKDGLREGVEHIHISKKKDHKINMKENGSKIKNMEQEK